MNRKEETILQSPIFCQTIKVSNIKKEQKIVHVLIRSILADLLVVAAGLVADYSLKFVCDYPLIAAKHSTD